MPVCAIGLAADGRTSKRDLRAIRPRRRARRRMKDSVTVGEASSFNQPLCMATEWGAKTGSSPKPSASFESRASVGPECRGSSAAVPEAALAAMNWSLGW